MSRVPNMETSVVETIPMAIDGPAATKQLRISGMISISYLRCRGMVMLCSLKCSLMLNPPYSVVWFEVSLYHSNPYIRPGRR